MTKNDERPEGDFVEKCKRTKSGWHFAWSEIEHGCCDRYTYTCEDAPRPELAESMQALAAPILQLLGIDVPVIVTGVTRKLDDEGTPGICLTMQHELPTGETWVINSPWFRATDDSPWPEGMYELVEDWQAECVRYIHGDRAQMGLPLDDGAGRKEVEE
jgi:hypothetical protein